MKPAYTHVDSDASQTEMRIAWRAVAETDPRNAAQQLLLRLLDDGMATPLHREVVDLDLQLWDAGDDPHDSAGKWKIAVDVVNGTFAIEGRPAVALGVEAAVGSLADDGGQGGLRFTVEAGPDLSAEQKQVIADRWAPTYLFDSTEEFFPVPGSALASFHGFYKNKGNWHTWDLDFNNGRGAYRLLLADFDGNRRTDHNDAQLMTDVLSAGPVAPPTVSAHVTRAHNGEVVKRDTYYQITVRDGDQVEIVRMVGGG